MVKLLPKKVFFVKGIGVADDPLLSFELALRDAGIERFNLVPVSSILPPNIEFVEKEEGLKELNDGEIVFCVMAKYTSNEEGKEIFAAIGYAIPKDKSKHGYLTEYYGIWDEKYKTYPGEIAKKMLEMKGIEVEDYGTIFIKTKVKKYTTVVAAAVFVL